MPIVQSGLARITPVNLMPERYSRHMQILTKLKQIRTVQVSCVPNTNRSYIVDVYTPSQSTIHIPTKGQQAATLFRQPGVHMEKQFSDFVRLRDELYECCQTAHPCMNCAFCSEVARYLLLGAVLPGTLLTRILPQNQRTKAVQRFVEALLQLAVSCPVIDSDACPCQEKLPRQLFKFLCVDPMLEEPLYRLDCTHWGSDFTRDM